MRNSPIIPLSLFCTVLAALFDRFVLLDHFACTSTTHVINFDASRFKITTGLTFVFWFASEAPASDSTHNLMTLKDNLGNLLLFELTYGQWSKFDLNFKIASETLEIKRYIFPIESIISSDYPPEIIQVGPSAITNTFWTCVVLILDQISTGTVKYSVVRNNVAIASEVTGTFSLNRFTISFGNQATQIQPCTLRFLIRHFYVYNQSYIYYSEETIQLAKNAPGTLVGLFKPRGYHQQQWAFINMVPGRNYQDIVARVWPKMPFIKMISPFLFVFDRQETSFTLPNNIIPNSPVDQSYTYTLLFQSYYTIQYYFDYIIMRAFRIPQHVVFAMYKRVNAYMNDDVRIAAQWVFKTDFTHSFVTIFDNLSITRLTNLMPTAKFANTRSNIPIPDQKNFFLLSVSNHCLEAIKTIEFYSYPMPSIKEIFPGLKLDASDLHMFGKMTTEAFSTIEFHVSEVSIVHGSEFAKSTNTLEPEAVTTLNFPSTNNVAFVLACKNAFNIRRNLKESNDILLTDRCDSHDSIESPSMPNCVFANKTQCVMCSHNSTLINGACVPESSRIFDSVGKEFYLSVTSAIPNISSFTEFKSSITSLLNQLDQSRVFLFKILFKSKFIFREMQFEKSLIWHSFEFFTANPYRDQLNYTEFTYHLNQFTESFFTFHIDCRKIFFDVYEIFMSSMDKNTYLTELSPLTPNFNCSNFNLCNLRRNRFEQICVAFCPRTHFLYNGKSCLKRVANCFVADQNPCTFCKEDFILVNNFCYPKTPLMPSPTTSPTNPQYASSISFTDPASIPVPPSSPSKPSPTTVQTPGGSLTSSSPEDVSSDPYFEQSQTGESADNSPIDCSLQSLRDNYSQPLRTQCEEQCKNITANCHLCTNNTCVKCLEGYSLEGLNCIRIKCADPNCALCLTTQSCLDCLAPYQLNYQSFCEFNQTSSSSPEAKDIIDKKEVSHNKTSKPGSNSKILQQPTCLIEDCKVCPDPNLCEVCQELYELSQDHKSCTWSQNLLVQPPGRRATIRDQIDQGSFSSVESKCIVCQQGKQLTCSENPNCSLSCHCNLKPGLRIDAFRLNCPNIFFNRTSVGQTSQKNSPYTLSMNPDNPHLIEINFWTINFQKPVFKIWNEYLNYTENCTNDEAKRYFVDPLFASNFTQTKMVMSIVRTSGSMTLTSSIFMLNIFSINLSQLLIGLINYSSFFVLINLLNIRLGYVYDFIVKATTEHEFQVENLLHIPSHKPNYSQIMDASVNRGWMYVGKGAFEMVLMASVAWLIVSNGIRTVLRISSNELRKSKVGRSLKWIRRGLKNFFVALMDFNYMTLITVANWFILQPRFVTDRYQLALIVGSNLVVVWGLIYSKYHIVMYYRRQHKLSNQTERVQIIQNFSPEIFSSNLHEFIEEQLQMIFGSVIFIFQDYPLRMLNALSLYTLIQIYLSFAFTGKYSMAITAMKLLFNMSFLFFVVTANSVFHGTKVTDKFLEVTTIVISGIKIAETMVIFIANIIAQRNIKNRSLEIN
jgi:hypothetical protein